MNDRNRKIWERWTLSGKPAGMRRIVLLILVIAAPAFLLVYFDQARRFVLLSSAYERLGGHNPPADSRDKFLLAALRKAPRNFLDAVKGGGATDLETVRIDVKPKYWAKLQEKRAKALEEGFLQTESDDYVPATISAGGRTLKAEIRLKGDLVDHLQGDKWSFRIHIKGDGHFEGMRRFSIQAPYTRSYNWDMMLMEHFRRKGLIAPRMFFVREKVNGRDLGVMMVEEHFSGELLAAHERPDGVILRIDESLDWAKASMLEKKPREANPFYNFANAPIRPFRSAEFGASPKLSAQLKTGVGLFRGFVDEKLPASEVFDADMMGRFLALAELWDSDHLMIWRNMRFYFNPVTAHFEPIPYDAIPPHPNAAPRSLYAEKNPITRLMLRDPSIRAAYIREIRLAVEELESNAPANELQRLEKDQLRRLRTKYPCAPAYDFEQLKRRGKALLKLVDELEREPAVRTEPTSSDRASRRLRSSGAAIDRRPIAEQQFPLILHAYLMESGGKQFLELANPLHYAVEVARIRWLPPHGADPVAFRPLQPLAFPYRMEPTPFMARPEFFRFPYERPERLSEGAELEITANIVGDSRQFSSLAQPYYPALDRALAPAPSLNEALEAHPFLRWNDERRTLEVEPGKWRVDGPLVLPESIPFIIPERTTLQFGKDAAIIARGPLWFEGTASATVVLEGFSAEAGWQGIVALRSGTPSRWSHTTVSGAGGVDWGGWRLAGVTFYEHEAELSGCRFFGSRADAALNIVRSHFALSEADFEEAQNDGFDAEFSDGVVGDSRFGGIGSVGVAVTGGKIKIDNVEMKNVAGRGIVVADRARAAIRGAAIEAADIGVASRDLSTASISASTIRGARIAGLAAYMEKSEFGAGEIQASGVTFDNDWRGALVQAGSRIAIDGREAQSGNYAIDGLKEMEQ